MHFDVELTLRWNLIEATTAGITLHINNTETVASVFTDTLEWRKETWFNLSLKVFHLNFQFFFLCTSFVHDLVEFVLLHFQGLTTVFDVFLIDSELLFLLCHTILSLSDFLITEFDFKFLKFDFFCQSVIFAVVLNLVQLLFVTFHADFGVFDIAFFLYDGSLILIDICLDFLDTSCQSFDFIFQVLYFQR